MASPRTCTPHAWPVALPYSTYSVCALYYIQPLAVAPSCIPYPGPPPPPPPPYVPDIPLAIPLAGAALRPLSSPLSSPLLLSLLPPPALELTERVGREARPRGRGGVGWGRARVWGRRRRVVEKGGRGGGSGGRGLLR